LVWASQGQNGHLAIFEATLVDDQWSATETLVSDEKENITPAITEGNDGTMLLAWISLDGNGRSLVNYLIRYSDGREVQGILNTSFEHNYSPSVLSGGDNSLWLAWAADNGTDEDVYASHFVSGVWNGAQKLNADNNRPDVTPLLILDSAGRVTVSWSQLGANGYETRQTTWNGSSFGTEEAGQSNPAELSVNRTLLDQLPALPEQAQDPAGMAIFSPSHNNGLQSIPEWVSDHSSASSK
jgi:hypothetical protein